MQPANSRSSVVASGSGSHCQTGSSTWVGVGFDFDALLETVRSLSTIRRNALV